MHAWHQTSDRDEQYCCKKTSGWIYTSTEQRSKFSSLGITRPWISFFSELRARRIHVLTVWPFPIRFGRVLSTSFRSLVLPLVLLVLLSCVTILTVALGWDSRVVYVRSSQAVPACWYDGLRYVTESFQCSHRHFLWRLILIGSCHGIGNPFSTSRLHSALQYGWTFKMHLSL